MITAIFATDSRGGMGKNLRMPWPRLDQDLAWFKSITVDQLVVMGSRTWLSEDMPRPLPRRINAVWSTQSRSQLQLPDSVLLLNQSAELSADWLLQRTSHKQIFVIGGAQTLNAWIGLCHRVYWTHIQSEFDCDTVLAPEQWQNNFCCEGYTQHQQHQLNFQITAWNRKL